MGEGRAFRWGPSNAIAPARSTPRRSGRGASRSGEVGGASEGSEDLTMAVFHHPPSSAPSCLGATRLQYRADGTAPLSRRKAGVRKQAGRPELKGAAPLLSKSRAMFLLRSWGLMSICRDLMAAVGYKEAIYTAQSDWCVEHSPNSSSPGKGGFRKEGRPGPSPLRCSFRGSLLPPHLPTYLPSCVPPSPVSHSRPLSCLGRDRGTGRKG